MCQNCSGVLVRHGPSHFLGLQLRDDDRAARRRMFAFALALTMGAASRTAGRRLSQLFTYDAEGLHPSVSESGAGFSSAMCMAEELAIKRPICASTISDRRRVRFRRSVTRGANSRLFMSDTAPSIVRDDCHFTYWCTTVGGPPPAGPKLHSRYGFLLPGALAACFAGPSVDDRARRAAHDALLGHDSSDCSGTASRSNGGARGSRRCDGLAPGRSPAFARAGGEAPRMVFSETVRLSFGIHLSGQLAGGLSRA